MTRKVAVVTGAARGLGEAVVRRLAAAGYAVALLGHEPDRLEQVAAACGADAGWWQVDVTDEAALRRVAGEVVDRFGGVDVVVANAGIAFGAPIVAADPATWDRVVEVNLLGSVRTARVFLPLLIERRGYLLQIASLAAIMPMPIMSAYGASKAGVEAYARAIGSELKHRGVTVGIAYLSWTDTDMVRGADTVKALARQRAPLPPPFNATTSLDRAADVLVAGIRRRRTRVWVPGWVRLAAMNRPFLHWFTSLVGPGRAAATEAALEAEVGTGVRALTGPGGAADLAGRPAQP
ncbi:SDR family oxidoreductase [Kineosporia sp. A_224]|uniref:SDR family oxidoreductase n=1 Tax=Kineosporia sp. A_224 TaxID=1962180 RepID=UPI000B4BA609|nr:SDR family oxidoreductase [Kineosporia sp. A_224]